MLEVVIFRADARFHSKIGVCTGDFSHSSRDGTTNLVPLFRATDAPAMLSRLKVQCAVFTQTKNMFMIRVSDSTGAVCKICAQCGIASQNMCEFVSSH